MGEYGVQCDGRLISSDGILDGANENYLMQCWGMWNIRGMLRLRDMKVDSNVSRGLIFLKLRGLVSNNWHINLRENPLFLLHENTFDFCL